MMSKVLSKIKKTKLYICEIIRYKLKGSYDIIFFASSSMDISWLESTIIECENINLKYAIVIGSTNIETLDKRINDNEYFIRGDFLKYLHPKIVITASSGIPHKWVGKRCKKFIHMPHSLVSLHMAYPEDAFIGYDILFACGDYQRNEMKKISKRNNDNILIYDVGYGKFDIMDKIERPSNLENSPVIMIAPSWGEGNILETFGETLIQYLINKNFNVILRPHPAYFIYYKNKIYNYKKIFGQYKNFIIENSSVEKANFSVVNYFVSDYSGTALEYAFFYERPVIFVNVPIKCNNKNWEKIDIIPIELSIRDKIGVIIDANIEEFENALYKIKKNNDQYKKNIIEEKNKNIYNYRKCARVATDLLYKFVNDLKENN